MCFRPQSGSFYCSSGASQAIPRIANSNNPSLLLSSSPQIRATNRFLTCREHSVTMKCTGRQHGELVVRPRSSGHHANQSRGTSRCINFRMSYRLLIHSECPGASIKSFAASIPYFSRCPHSPSVPGIPPRQWPPIPQTKTNSLWLTPLLYRRNSKSMAQWRPAASPSPTLSSKVLRTSPTQSSTPSATSPTPFPSPPS
jgi:hypothetical protein